MTKVTLVENGTMAAMAAVMLAGCTSPMPNTPLASLGIEDAASLQVSVMALDGDTYPDMDDFGSRESDAWLDHPCRRALWIRGPPQSRSFQGDGLLVASGSDFKHCSIVYCMREP